MGPEETQITAFIISKLALLLAEIWCRSALHLLLLDLRVEWLAAFHNILPFNQCLRPSRDHVKSCKQCRRKIKTDYSNVSPKFSPSNPIVESFLTFVFSFVFSSWCLRLASDLTSAASAWS